MTFWPFSYFLAWAIASKKSEKSAFSLKVKETLNSLLHPHPFPLPRRPHQVSTSLRAVFGPCLTLGSSYSVCTKETKVEPWTVARKQAKQQSNRFWCLSKGWAPSPRHAQSTPGIWRPYTNPHTQARDMLGRAREAATCLLGLTALHCLTLKC